MGDEQASRVTTDPGIGWLLFSLSGRIGRKLYVLSTLLIVMVIATMVSRLSAIPEGGNEFALWGFVFIIMMPVVLWISLATAIKRLHDMNTPGAVAICLLVPAVSLLTILILSIWKGNSGPNDYGHFANRPKQ